MLRIAAAVLLLASLSAGPAAQGGLEITLPNRPGAVRFMAMGDNGTGERQQYELAEQMVAARQQFPFDFVIMLGDNIYGSQRPADLARKFERPYKSLLDAGVLFYASLGNHDSPNNRFYTAWNMGGERYYTFTKGDVRFFVLDTDAVDTAQLRWLEAALAASNDPWKIAYFHHPLYSSGGRHGSQDSLRRVIEPLLVKYGVNAVFSGHDHVYERIKPQRGIYYFVVGSSGQLRRGDLRTTTLTAAGYDRDQVFLLAEIDDDSMSVQAISRVGRTVDRATLVRQPRQAAEPAVAR